MGDSFRLNSESTGDNIILYDASCGFCKGNVKTLMKLDSNHRITFIPLQSQDGKAILGTLPAKYRETDSVILVLRGEPYLESAAVIRSLIILGGFWSLFRIFLRMPRLTDALYRFIAKNRYLLGKNEQMCKLP